MVNHLLEAVKFVMTLESQSQGRQASLFVCLYWEMYKFSYCGRSTFAVDGKDCKVNGEVERVLKDFHKAGKPIGYVS